MATAQLNSKSEQKKYRKRARLFCRTDLSPHRHEFTYEEVARHRLEMLKIKAFLASDDPSDNKTGYRTRKTAYKMYWFHRSKYKFWLNLLKDDHFRVDNRLTCSPVFYVPLP